MEKTTLCIRSKYYKWKFDLIKTESKKTLEYCEDSEKYVGELTDYNYNILKDYADNTLKNISINVFTPFNSKVAKTMNINIEINIPYCDEKKGYYIILNKIKEEDPNVTIGEYTFAFIKNDKKISIVCEINNEKYSLDISEEKYQMLQDYKNNNLPKDCTISSNYETPTVAISIRHIFYDYSFMNYLYLKKQTREDKINEKLIEQINIMNNSIKELTEKVSKLEKN